MPLIKIFHLYGMEEVKIIRRHKNFTNYYSSITLLMNCKNTVEKEKEIKLKRETTEQYTHISIKKR